MRRMFMRNVVPVRIHLMKFDAEDQERTWSHGSIMLESTNVSSRFQQMVIHHMSSEGQLGWNLSETDIILE